MRSGVGGISGASVERFLQHRVAEILGVPLDGVDSGSALSRLGVDSLGMLHLLESIESDLGREIPSRMCFDQLTIRSLASALSTASTSVPRMPGALIEQMLADGELPQEICPDANAAPLESPRSILLTGATGFLGAFLLRALLRATNAQVVCLTRPSHCDGKLRIRQNLERYGVWNDEFHHRITAFEADISQPRLGLSPSSFDALAAGIDVVFHGAASVNWVLPYMRLRNANVLAVRELLRLACRHGSKPFHFISTLAVCYSTTGSRGICESDDPFPDVSGIHLGYAQSKCVAESLVRTAAGRGLPVCIFRPALISGDSLSGMSNTGDFLSSFIKGCVQIGAAPDLDWRLDLLPVDFAAAVIARLALSRHSRTFEAFHLANPKVRHWRELILWMNLFGYRIALLPYEEWYLLLKTDVSTGRGNALRDLWPFFRHQPEDQRGLYLAQLYEESRRRKVDFVATRQTLAAAGLDCPRLSTAVLDRYFTSFIDQQFLPSVGRQPGASESASEFDVSFLGSVIRDSEIVRATPIEFSGGHSIIGELTSWKYGRSIGLHSYRLEFASGNALDVIVKVKARDQEVVGIGQTLAALCSPEIGGAYRRFSDSLGLSGCHIRELALYQQDNERFRLYTPAFHGGRVEGRLTFFILEKLSGMELMDSADDIDAWQPAHIEAAIDGIAELHSIWYGQHQLLAGQPWLGQSPTRRSVVEARELWIALAKHAEPIFSGWIGPEGGSIQRSLLDRLDDCWLLAETMPRTLIHNDFNPRNLAFRRNGNERRLCVYDWELATVGLPQHDLAELLCFVVGPKPQSTDLLSYIERHRVALERATGSRIAESSWLLGFRLSLYDLMINRLPAYAMIHHFQQQRFLERVICTWKAIYDVANASPAGRSYQWMGEATS